MSEFYIPKTAAERFKALCRSTFGHCAFSPRVGGFHVTVDCEFSPNEVKIALDRVLKEDDYYQLKINSVSGSKSWFIIKYEDTSTGQRWCVR